MRRAEIDRLIRLHERCRTAVLLQKQRRQLLWLHSAHAKGKIGSPAAREAVKDVVSALKGTPTPRVEGSAKVQVQLCAAALLSRLAESGEGTRQVLACGGLQPLLSLWESAGEEPLSATAAAGEGRGLVPYDSGGGGVAEVAALELALLPEHSRLAGLYASHALARLVVSAPNSSSRAWMLQEGVLSPLLALAAPALEPPSSTELVATRPGGAEHESQAEAREREAAERGAAERDAARGAQRAWREELRLASAAALLALAKKESSRPSLLAGGTLFRWLELAASAEPAVVRLAVHALRLVSESESLRGRMLSEPGLLQSLVHLTNSDEAEAQRHALLAVMQLSAVASQLYTFLGLLPAMPLAALAASGSIELQHATARLFFLLGRGGGGGTPAGGRATPHSTPDGSGRGGSQGGCAAMDTLAEAASTPLVVLCGSGHPQVQCAAAQAVARLAGHCEGSRQLLYDEGVLPPLVAALTSPDVHVRHHASVAIKQLSLSSSRRHLLARPKPIRALVGCVLELQTLPTVGCAAIWAISNATTGTVEAEGGGRGGGDGGDGGGDGSGDDGSSAAVAQGASSPEPIATLRTLLLAPSREGFLRPTETASRSLLRSIAQHLPPLPDGHMPAARLLLHLAQTETDVGSPGLGRPRVSSGAVSLGESSAAGAAAGVDEAGGGAVGRDSAAGTAPATPSVTPPERTDSPATPAPPPVLSLGEVLATGAEPGAGSAAGAGAAVGAPRPPALAVKDSVCFAKDSAMAELAADVWRRDLVADLIPALSKLIEACAVRLVGRSRTVESGGDFCAPTPQLMPPTPLLPPPRSIAPPSTPQTPLEVAAPAAAPATAPAAAPASAPAASTPAAAPAAEQAAAPTAAPSLVPADPLLMACAPDSAPPMTPLAECLADDHADCLSICFPLCRAARLVLELGLPPPLRAMLAKGCGPSLYTMHEHGGEPALAELAWVLLGMLGYPDDAHQLRELAAEGPNMLSEWWSLDRSLRSAAKGGAAPLAGSDADSADALCRMPAEVDTLVLSARAMTDFRFGPVLRRLVADHPRATSLAFDGCSFSDAFVSQLPAVLARLVTITTLTFRGAPDASALASSGRAAMSGAAGTREGPSWLISGVAVGGGGDGDALAYLPIDLPASVTELHVTAGAISRSGVRTLSGALNSASSLRTLSLAHGGFRASDLAPLFSMLQGGGGGGGAPGGLVRLSLRANRLQDGGVHQLVEALCTGSRTGAGCQLQALDLAANQLTPGCVDDLCKLLGSLGSLLELSVSGNAPVWLGGSGNLVNAVRGGGGLPGALEAIASIPSLFSGHKSRAKDLLIAVLTNNTLCELHIDPGFLSAKETAQLQGHLATNRASRVTLLAHSQVGAAAPPLSNFGPEGARPGSARMQRVIPWNKRAVRAPGEVPVLGVLFSAPLVCTDPASGLVHPMEMLDFAKEKALICDSLREARRNIRLRFEHATTDRLRTVVTLGACSGLHYSGHGDPTGLLCEDGRGGAHFVRVPALKKLLQAGGVASLQFVFVSACFSEAAAQAFIEAGVPHVVAVKVNTRVSDHAAHAFTRAFYLALAVGQTLQASYDIGVQAVVTSPVVPSGDLEGDKFLLLPLEANHEVAPFPDLANLDEWKPPAPPAAARQQPLPAAAECFLGRNVETYRVVTAVLDRRLVTVTGVPGVGKSAVARAALNFLAERHYFSDGVLYADCSAATTAEELVPLLAARTSRYATQPPPPAEPSAEGATEGEAVRARAASGESTAEVALELAIAPLASLHCLLVLDGVSPALTSGCPAFVQLLVRLLACPRLRTLLTAVSPVSQPLEGGAEKARRDQSRVQPHRAPAAPVPPWPTPVLPPLQVVEVKPLSRMNTARLLCRLSPRPLLLSELPGAASAADFLNRLAQHALVEALHGNAGLVKETAPKLQTARIDEVTRSVAGVSPASAAAERAASVLHAALGPPPMLARQHSPSLASLSTGSASGASVSLASLGSASAEGRAPR